MLRLLLIAAIDMKMSLYDLTQQWLNNRIYLIRSPDLSLFFVFTISILQVLGRIEPLIHCWLFWDDQLVSQINFKEN